MSYETPRLAESVDLFWDVERAITRGNTREALDHLDVLRAAYRDANEARLRIKYEADFLVPRPKKHASG